MIILFLQLIYFLALGSKAPQKHFAFLFSLLIYFVYIFLGPLNAIQTENYYIFGTYFGDVFTDTVLLYNIAIFFFGSAYFIAYNYTGARRSSATTNWFLSKNYYKFLLFFFLCLAYIITRKANVADGGGDFSGGFLNYLIFMSDSLIIAFLILLSEKKMKKWHLILLCITVIFYLILGFRYRIIILLVGVLYHFFVVNRISLGSILKWFSYIVITFLIINFISVNRTAFREMDFENIEFTSDSPSDMSPYQFIMHQTGNHKTDMMVYKYMANNILVQYDLGESMFLHIFVRIIPSEFFYMQTKPAIPQQQIIRNSTGTDEGLNAGLAVTNIMEYYIAGGPLGIIIFMSIMGITVGYISKRTNINNARDRVIIMILMMVLFQEITRGYLPQSFTLLCFLYLTFYFFYKKKYAGFTN